MARTLVELLACLITTTCAHGPAETPTVDRERFPNNCCDGDPITLDDSLVDGICVGVVDPDRDAAPNAGAGPACVGPDTPAGCVDNCAYLPNPEQKDGNLDGVGDACAAVAVFDHVETSEKVVALTFDDGYDDAALAGILDALESCHARGTFFLNGLYVPDGTLKQATLKRLRQGGHLAGNHTFHHSLGRDAAELREELSASEKAFAEAAGLRLRPLFRSPAYEVTPWLDQGLLSGGYTVNLSASMDFRDWAAPPPPPEGMVKCAVEQVSPGDILLFHVGPSSTPVALPVILQELSARGYHFVTVQELILFGPPASYGAARLCDEYYL